MVASGYGEPSSPGDAWTRGMAATGRCWCWPGGRPTLTATPITDGPPQQTGRAEWRPILAAPVGAEARSVQATRGDPAHTRRCRHRRCHPRSQPDDSNARTLRFDVQFSDFFLVDVGEPNLSLGDYVVFHDLLCWSIPRRRRPVGPCMPSSGVGWQPSRFLADPPEAERAFALAERLGSVNAAAAELGTTWPSLRKAFQRHSLGMPARNPQAVRQRAIETARQRSGRPVTPSLDPVFVALNHGELPIRARSGGSWPSGSAAPRTTPPSAPTSWSNSTREPRRQPHHQGVGDHPPRPARPPPPPGPPPARRPPPCRTQQPGRPQ
jgi:hypothetical protein